MRLSLAGYMGPFGLAPDLDSSLVDVGLSTGEFLPVSHPITIQGILKVESDILQWQIKGHRITEKVVSQSRKFAPYRTWILRLMGDYYWLIGKNGIPPSNGGAGRSKKASASEHGWTFHKNFLRGHLLEC